MSKRRTLIDIILVSAIGTLLHFVYDWSGQNAAIGIIGAVNESTWEHLKLLYWPVAILSIVEFFCMFKRTEGFLFSRFIGLFCGIITIVTLFYTVTGIVGKSIDVFNIALYYISVIITFLVSNIIVKNRFFCKSGFNIAALILFAAMAAAFAGFTFNPPDLGIFKDPTK